MAGPEEVIDSESTRHHGVDAALAKRVLRKIDMRLIPLLFITYGLNFMDKTILSSASVFGLRDDTVSLFRLCTLYLPANYFTHTRIASRRPAIFLGLLRLLLRLPLLDPHHQPTHLPPPHRPLPHRQHLTLGHRRRPHSSMHQLWRPPHRPPPLGRRRSHHHPGLHVHDHLLLHT